MNNLQQSLKVSLANTFALALKSQFYHWNVTGPNFSQYHEFFGDLYGELFAAVDVIAELIRQVDDTAPGSLSSFKELTMIECATTVPEAVQMFEQLEKDNKVTLASLYTVYKEAEAISELGISNIIQDRLSAHHKHDWMIKSFK